MTELGNRLKEARLAKGLSLDDLQTITKIQKRYLVGIEEGNYSSMPGNFYVRAFIKQYAEAVQLNPDEIFETYKSEVPSTHHEDLPEKLSRVKTHKGLSTSSPKILDILPKILIGVFVIGIIALLYYFFSQHAGNNSNDSINKESKPVNFEKSANLDKDKAKEKKKNEKKKKDESKKDETSDTPVQEAPKQELTVTQSAGSRSSYELKNADKFEIKVVSTGQTWVNIKNGKGQSFFQGLLEAGKPGKPDSQTVDLSKESEALIVVGRTLDTEIYVNGQKLEYAVPPADVVSQKISISYIPKQ